jgi:hypothetical protein
MNDGRVVQYRTLRRHPARRGHPALEAGTILWLIEYPNGRLFTYGYVLKVSAAKVKASLTGTQQEIDFNSVSDPEAVMQSWIDPGDVR